MNGSIARLTSRSLVLPGLCTRRKFAEPSGLHDFTRRPCHWPSVARSDSTSSDQ
jgi:hypothetical protein